MRPVKRELDPQDIFNPEDRAGGVALFTTAV
jgi:hypothetical protein